MKRILIVDDDAVVVCIYRDALARRGFTVDVAEDGLAAIQLLRTTKPDLLVLDLMMPKLSGLDLLKYVRSQPQMKELPVIVLSNSFMNALGGEAVALGVQRAVLKVRSTPDSLETLINDVLSGKESKMDPSAMLAVPRPEPALKPKPAATPAAAPATGTTAATKPAPPQDAFQMNARKDLLTNAPKIRAELLALALDLSRAQNEVETDIRLSSLYRRVHFLAVIAGMAGAQDVALLASAFEALLFELMGRPSLITPSVRRTLGFTSDFLAVLLDRVHKDQVEATPSPKALVVDDDPLSNRLVTAALRRAQLTAASTEDPVTALDLVRETHYDLILLDVEMPVMSGFDLCKQIREMPGYRHTPVVFVTNHADFESRSKVVLSGGNDLIAKPVLPIELAVKSVALLLKNNLDAQTATAAVVAG